MPAWDGEADRPRGRTGARATGGALVLRVFVTGKGGNGPPRVEAADGASRAARRLDAGPGAVTRFEVPAGTAHVEISVVEEQPGEPAR